MADINITGFSGMNNLIPSFWGGKGVASPRVLLNADADESGQLVKRDGVTAYLALAGANSLWACELAMLCAANKKLYSIGTGAAVQLATITGPSSEPLSYALAEDKIYISNSYWRGVFDASTGTVSDWGVTLPPGPMVLTAAGNLPAGTYHLTFTAVSGSQLSGNGPISSITLSTTGGIQILNRPAWALVWATDQNGTVFQLVGAVDTIVDIPTVEPLPSFMCSPPPNMSVLLYAFGRIWGSVGNVLYYSEPYQFGWFKVTSNFFKFNSDITIIAAVSTGLFIGKEDSTVFLQGTEPDQMVQSSAGAGSIKGTLVYCNNLPELGDVLGTPEKGYSSVPVWRTTEGIVAGNTSGRLFNLTKTKLKMGIPEKGASLYRSKNGVFQFLTSAILSSGATDADALSAFLTGALPSNNIVNKNPTSSVGLTETVSAEQWRGGVLIST